MPLTWIPLYLRAGWPPARATGSPRAASGAHAGCSGPRPPPLGVFSTPAAEGSVRCAAGPAFSSGCGRWHCRGPPPSPPTWGVLCPLIRCLLLSLARGWQPLTQLAGCGAAMARAMGSGACQSPSTTRSCPITFNPPISAGAWCLVPKSRAGLERGGATGVEPGPGGQRRRPGGAVTP